MSESINTRKSSILYMTQLALLTAIIFLFQFTPIGMIKFSAFSITFVSIPVAVGAALLGPAAGAVLGLFWGLTSFIQALMGMDLGPVLLAASPVLTLLVCLLPRVIAGFLAGLASKGIAGIRHGTPTELASFAAAGLIAPVTNTVLFLGGLFLAFRDTFVSVLLPLLGTLVVFNAVPEAVACVVVTLAVGKPLRLALRRAR